MLEAYGPQTIQSREMLVRCRSVIDRFPLRQQTALLHEFEEAETRQSAIEMSTIEADAALATPVGQNIASGIHSKTTPVDFQEKLRLLRFLHRTLKEQLNERQRP